LQKGLESDSVTSETILNRYAEDVLASSFKQQLLNMIAIEIIVNDCNVKTTFYGPARNREQTS